MKARLIAIEIEGEGNHLATLMTFALEAAALAGGEITPEAINSRVEAAAGQLRRDRRPRKIRAAASQKTVKNK